MRDGVWGRDLLALDGLLRDLRAVASESKANSAASFSLGEGPLGWISIGCLVSGWAISLSVPWGIPAQANYLALILLLLGAIAAAVSAVGVVMSTVREWGEMESSTLDAVGENMSRWYGTISRIRATYSREQILFAQGYVSDVAVQARARLALFVGALEKVGIIPMVASVALTLANFFKSGSMPLLWFTAAVVAGVFYVLALRLVDIAFTLERFALILRHAIAEKDGR